MTNRKPKAKPTYRGVVITCWAVLIAGSALLAYLMETRQMAPPRKYEVNMKGDIIGIDNGPKIPVLTQEEAEAVELKKEERRRERAKKPEKRVEEEAKPAEELIVPSVPTEAPSVKNPTVSSPKPDVQVAKPEISAPKIEKIE